MGPRMNLKSIVPGRISRSAELFLAAIAIDGLGQLFGLWTSTWWSRVLTGGLFGLGCFWLTYPHLERGMSEVRQESRRALKEWRQ